MAVLLSLLGLWNGCATSTAQVDTASKIDRQDQGAFVWKGFHHSWTYNHRLNRLGSYVGPLRCGIADAEEASPERGERARCKSSLVHAAASGTGADEATFTSRYAEVVAPEVGFQTGSVKLRFDGKEERDLRVEKTVNLEAVGQLHDRTHYTVLLNGFDAYTAGDRARAKKVKRFRIWTRGDGEYDSDEQSIEVKIGGLMNMNCDSVECKYQSNRVRYTVEVRFLLIAHDANVRDTPKTFETSYQWNKKTELSGSGISLNARTNHIQGLSSDFSEGLLGFRELDFDVGKKGRYKDQWFVTWANLIRRVNYDSQTGRAEFDLHLLFKEWNARSKEKLTSLARKGEATIKATVVLMQFKSARIRRHEQTGTIKWPGRNRSPLDKGAVWRRDLTLDL